MIGTILISQLYIFGPKTRIDGFLSGSVSIVDRKNDDFGIFRAGFGWVFAGIYLMEFNIGIVAPSIKMVDTITGLTVPIGSIQLGMLHEFKFMSSFAVHPVITLMGGIGFTYYTRQGSNTRYQDIYFFFEPSAGVELNFVPGVRFVFHAGYRYNSDLYLRGLNLENIDAPIYTLSVRLGNYR